MNDEKLLVTGCLGFIGSYFCKYAIRNYPKISITGIGRNTNQKNLKRLEDLLWNPRFKLVFKDFAKDDLSEEFDGAEYIFHFGAKTFVNYSIQNPEPFIESNIVGTFKVLEQARRSRSLKMYFQVSTDEVYGSILTGSYKEDARPNPTNPYSATKMAGDMLAVSYHNSYDLPIIVTRTENNYGPYQGVEKVFPTFVKKALNNEPLPIYGDGKHIRCWLYVEDHVRALLHLTEKGKAGEIYHVAGEQELENLELAKRILRLLNKPENMVKFIPDTNIRPGHDRRYSLNVEKLRATGWMPKFSLEEGIKMTVSWYLQNQWWLT